MRFHPKTGNITQMGDCRLFRKNIIINQKAGTNPGAPGRFCSELGPLYIISVRGTIHTASDHEECGRGAGSQDGYN